VRLSITTVLLFLIQVTFGCRRVRLVRRDFALEARFEEALTGVPQVIPLPHSILYPFEMGDTKILIAHDSVRFHDADIGLDYRLEQRRGPRGCPVAATYAFVEVGTAK
jgi:hypothetical protein